MATLKDYKATDLSSINKELESQGLMPDTSATDAGITSVLTGDLAPTSSQLGQTDTLEKYTLPQSLAIAGEAGLSGIETSIFGKPKKLSPESQRLINTLQGYKRSPDDISRFKLEDVLNPELIGGNIIGNEFYGSPTEEQIKKTWDQVKKDDETPYDFSEIAGQTAGIQWLIPAAKEYWKKKMLANMALEGAGILRKRGKDYIKKKKTPTITTAKTSQNITQKPKWTPPQQTQTGGGGLHSGMKTKSKIPDRNRGSIPKKTKAPKKSKTYQTASYTRRRRADGGLINFFKNGGFLG